MVFVSVGSITMSAMLIEASKSVLSGFHVAPPSVVFHTPPQAAPTNIVFGSPGKKVRQLILPAPPPFEGMTLGPMGIQVVDWELALDFSCGSDLYFMYSFHKMSAGG